jgi:hypothetical protein
MRAETQPDRARLSLKERSMRLASCIPAQRSTWYKTCISIAHVGKFHMVCIQDKQAVSVYVLMRTYVYVCACMCMCECERLCV